MKLIFTLVIGFLNYTTIILAGGGTWSEFGDAPSFPDGQPQVTRGAGSLMLIDGTTFPASDPRNAYCIKVTDPEGFRVTTDNAIDNAANTDFDTSLYLFDKNGKPLLFNDDTPNSTASSITSVTNDGSGFVLTQSGEYILVVAGFPDKPLDNIANNLFNTTTQVVNSANPNSGKFQAWENNNPATGGYFLAMQGAEFCQDKLDVIGTNSSATDSSMCFGDGQGEFETCNNISSTSDKDDIATGYFNKDKYLDVMFDNFGESPTLCLGMEKNGFGSCRSLDIGVTNTTDIAMADVNNDGNLDAAFIYGVGMASDVVKVCMGNGNNGFTGVCSDVTIDNAFHSNLDFAYMNGDNNIDLIVHGFNAIRICFGDGQGNFSPCNAVNVQSGRGLSIADVNNDSHLDVVTYAEQQPSQVCTNDGSGVLSCTAMNAFANDTTGVAMDDLNGDGNVDAVFSNNEGFTNALNQVCIGDGLAGFTCSDVSGVAENHKSVSLGYVNDDNILDVVFGITTSTRICYGVGDGTFTGCHNDTKLKLDQVMLGEFGDFSKWIEINDAPSFPDGQAQVTRGKGQLPFIVGQTNLGATDTRDAYCIKIDDPANFSATTDALTDSNANADFDTRLFLFDKKGKTLLFNDDTPPSATPFASTLTSATTDGSGYVLSQPGEYILVVAGFSDDPLDNIANNLFNQTASLVHAPIPNSNHFATWENNNPQTGGYFIALQGVSFCQDKLDIVGTSSSLTNDSLMCSGDGAGGFGNCNSDSINSVKSQIVTGYLDNDEHLDVIFDSFLFDIPSICLGNGKGGYKSCSVYTGLGTDNTHTTLMGDINNDGDTDAVFIAYSENHKACLGNGSGGFVSCTDVSNSNLINTNAAQLAYIDADDNLDLIYRTVGFLHICPGNGIDGFNACVQTAADVNLFEIADVNHDGSNDIIATREGGTNKVCLNDGVGGLTCSDISAQTNRTFGLAVSDLNNDGHVDVVFSNVNGVNPGINQVCLNDGNAAFTCSTISGAVGDYVSIKLGLINDDNILDIVITGGSFTRVCTGNGDGTFSNCVNDTSLSFFDIEIGEFGQPLPDSMFIDGFE